MHGTMNDIRPGHLYRKIQTLSESWNAWLWARRPHRSNHRWTGPSTHGS